jgi:hypothetical protein
MNSQSFGGKLFNVLINIDFALRKLKDLYQLEQMIEVLV